MSLQYVLHVKYLVTTNTCSGIQSIKLSSEMLWNKSIQSDKMGITKRRTNTLKLYMSNTAVQYKA